MALSKFGGKAEKCGRGDFHFADFANLSGDAGSDELQRDLGRQRGQVGWVQAGVVRTCGEDRGDWEDVTITGLTLLENRVWGGIIRS